MTRYCGDITFQPIKTLNNVLTEPTMKNTKNNQNLAHYIQQETSLISRKTSVEHETDCYFAENVS